MREINYRAIAIRHLVLDDICDRCPHVQLGVVYKTCQILVRIITRLTSMHEECSWTSDQITYTQHWTGDSLCDLNRVRFLYEKAIHRPISCNEHMLISSRHLYKNHMNICCKHVHKLPETNCRHCQELIWAYIHACLGLHRNNEAQKYCSGAVRPVYNSMLLSLKFAWNMKLK